MTRKHPDRVYRAWNSLSNWEQQQWVLAAVREQEDTHSVDLFAKHLLANDPQTFLAYCNFIELRLAMPFHFAT